MASQGAGSTRKRKDSARTLGYRDEARMRMAYEFMEGGVFGASEIAKRHYQNVAPSSFHKTFKRDREKLEEQGIYLKETANGTAKYWSLDKERSLAKLDASGDEDARCVAVLLEAMADQVAGEEGARLGQAAARIGRMSVGGTALEGRARDCKPEVFAAVTDAWRNRTRCRMLYQSLTDEEPRWRTLSVYGLFEIGSQVYAVGLREREGASPEMRTLNLGRAHEVESVGEKGAYSVPDDFDISEWRLLPFEIGSEEAYEATMYVPRAATGTFREQARRRGWSHRRQGGSIEWHVTVRNTEQAAMWAVEVGAIPTAPHALVDAWKSLLEEARHHDSN